MGGVCDFAGKLLTMDISAGTQVCTSSFGSILTECEFVLSSSKAQLKTKLISPIDVGMNVLAAGVFSNNRSFGNGQYAISWQRCFFPAVFILS